jgi:hypothetical protein
MEKETKTKDILIANPQTEEESNKIKAYFEKIGVNFITIKNQSIKKKIEIDKNSNEAQVEKLNQKLIRFLLKRFSKQSESNTYNKNFVKKIEESRKQVKEGKTVKVNNDNLKEFLGLE